MHTYAMYRKEILIQPTPYEEQISLLLLLVCMLTKAVSRAAWPERPSNS